MASPGQRRRGDGSPFVSPSRLQERTDLFKLNERLAAYIDAVRTLRPDQTDHQSLIEEITQDTRRTYEAKLDDFRAEREQEARGRAQLQVELDKIREEHTELGDSNNRVKADLEAALTRKRELQGLLNTRDAALNTAVDEKRALEADMRNLKDNLTELTENSSLLKRKLQEETLSKLEAENHLQTLNDKLEFQKNSHAEEKKHLQGRYDELLAKSIQSQQEFEDKLASTIADLRAQHEEELNSTKEDIEKNYESKLEIIQRELERKEQQVANITMERQENRNRIRDLSGQVIDQQNQITDLGFKLAGEQDLNNDKDREMAEVQKKLQQKEEECQNLHVAKEALNREIAAYRNMLEGEEKRLHLSPSPSRSLERTPTSGSGTTSRRLFSHFTPPSGRGGKRLRPSSISPGTPGSQGSPVKKTQITQKASARGRIIVDEVDLDGKFVRLKNKSGEDQPLTNWCLKGQVGNSTPSMYKFPRGFILKAGQTVTIWAASAGTTQNLPSDLVYQGLETWGTGDRQFFLMNEDEEEMATRTVKCTEQFHGLADDDVDEDDDNDDDDDGVTPSTSGAGRDYNLRSRTVISERDHSNQSSPAIRRAREQP